MDLETIWKKALDLLSAQMTRATYNAVFVGSKLVDDNGLVVQVTSEQAKDWLEIRLKPIVVRALDFCGLGGGITSNDLRVELMQRTKPAPLYLNDEIHIRDERKGRRYSIDREFIFDGYSALIGPHATALYNVLVAHAKNDTQNCTRYLSTLVLFSGVSESEVKRSIKRLEHHHIIYVERKKSKPAMFSLLDISEWTM